MSDKNLGQLITSLKTEAIEVAEKESTRILEGATTKAKKTLEKAEAERDRIISEATQEAQAMKNKGESALRQAARDFNISVRNDLLTIFKAVFETEIRNEFTPDLIKTAIVKVIENVDSDVELRLEEEFIKELAEYTHSRLKSSKNLVSIVEDNSILKGFSIIQKDNGWSYTISPEEVASALENHLNNKWMKILKKEV